MQFIILSQNPFIYDPATNVFLGHDDNKVWDAVTGEIINTLTGHSGSVTSVSFSPDGSRIVSGSQDNSVRVWDAVTG